MSVVVTHLIFVSSGVTLIKYLREVKKPRRRLQRERHQAKDLMSETIALFTVSFSHLHYNKI